MRRESKLFPEFRGQKVTAPSPPQLATPLGRFETKWVQAQWVSASVEPCETVKEGESTLSLWSTPQFELGCLQSPFTPKIPDNFPEVSAWIFLWRFQCLTECQGISITADGHFGRSGAPNSGEGLEALQWEDEDVEMHLGTEAADDLTRRAESEDWMPLRLASTWHLYSGNVDWDPALPDLGPQYRDSGITIFTPQLQANERCQFQFILSWVDLELPDAENSTWHAVDQRYRHALTKMK